jgi:hypothetical protein
VLKKVGFVTAAAVALSLVAAPAFAATTPHAAPQDGPSMTAPWDPQDNDDAFGFPQALRTFIWGGGALGAGAAAVIGGAYSGIATTPALILNSLEHHHHG